MRHRVDGQIAVCPPPCAGESDYRFAGFAGIALLAGTPGSCVAASFSPDASPAATFWTFRQPTVFYYVFH